MLPQALAGSRHCRAEYFPDSVAKRFAELGREAVAIFETSGNRKR
jgi:hypothetical protein